LTGRVTENLQILGSEQTSDREGHSSRRVVSGQLLPNEYNVTACSQKQAAPRSCAGTSESGPYRGRSVRAVLTRRGHFQEPTPEQGKYGDGMTQ